jgi:hypothetical protein
MIKKLLPLYLFTVIIGIVSSFGQASCTPNLSCLPGGATEGICPDSTTGIPAGVIGTPYSTSMSIKIPTSYTSGGTTYNFTHFAITDVSVDTSASASGTYYPLSVIGMDYLGNGTNSPSGASGISSYTMTKYCYWSSPGTACVVLTGTPTKAGTFHFKIKSQIRAFIIAAYTWFPAPDNTQYRLVVATTAGIDSPDLNKFEVKQNTPNPFNVKSDIVFTSANSSDVDFKIFNMLGNVVYSKVVKSERGSNTVTVDASTLSPGIYMYSLKNGDKTITKRMIVTNK